MPPAPVIDAPTLRRTVLMVVALNAGGFVAEVLVALAIGSASLIADSVDFVEDTAVNLLIALALGWPCTGEPWPVRRWPASSCWRHSSFC